MKRMLIALFVVLAGSAQLARAQNPNISGKIVEVSGAAVSGATVSAANLTTGAVVRNTSDAEGKFNIQVASSDTQLLTIEKSGFEPYTHVVSFSAGRSVVVNATLTVATLAQTVVVRGTVVPGARPQPTREQVLNSDQSLRVLDRKQLDAAGPVAGGAQMISLTPGANVFGYGVSGATKYTIQLNGINQGWGGQPSGFTAPGSLGITFDGIPIVDEATDLWQSATMPQNLLMQNLSTTYGPGAPADRFYTNVGGSVEFTPIQPTVSHHFSVAATYGLYGQKNIAFVGNTGNFHGWSTVVGGGVGDGNDFRDSPDGFDTWGQSGSVFGKTIREFSRGSLEFGAFYAKAGGFRPPSIPLTDQGVMLSRPDGSTYSYSQATCGFYCAPERGEYNKYDTNEMGLVYARENLLLNDTTTVTNTTWFMHIRRFHRRNNDIFAGAPGSGQIQEWNNPHSDAFGDKIGLQKVLPYNTLNFGAYLIHEVYNTRNLFYGTSLGGDGATETVNPGAKFRSGYFQQDDIAFFAQDDIHPIPQIHITPGVRVVGFSTSYSDQFQRDFNLLPGVIPSTHCSLYASKAGVSGDPYSNIFGSPNATDQGSLCGAHESKNQVEPSIDAGVMPFSWLTIYGGYDITYRSPSLGGGGGMFQKVNPSAYLLAEGKYGQGGAKIHFRNAPLLRNFILGVSYYHLDYANQELDYTLQGTGEQITAGGSSTYHGVNAFFDDDPRGNLHFFLNFSGEAANFSNYILGGASNADCVAQAAANGGANPCTYYNGLPVSYVPNVTLNSGIYYGIVNHNERTLFEPHFWINYTGPQHIFNNNTGAPDTTTMPSYTTANASVTVPFKNFNFRVDMLNLFNSKANTYEYISSGGYFGTATSGYINAYPGAPFTAFGTIAYSF